MISNPKFVLPLFLFAFIGCSIKNAKPSVPNKTQSKSQLVLGAEHVGLSVVDLEASKQFFVEALDFRVLGEDKNYPAYFLTNGLIVVTLWRVEDVTSHVAFSRKQNVGLHHLAFGVESFERLKQLFVVLNDYPGVSIEFSPELLHGGPSRHMIFREPSGVRLELIHRVSD